MELTKASIKYVQSLRIKKFRQKYHHFVVEGSKAVTEVLNSDWPVKQVYHTSDFAPPELRNVLSTTVSNKELERLSHHQAPQKALAVVEQKQFELPNPQALNRQLSLALDGVQDPGNLGTLIRICDWFGVEHLFCSKETADLFNPKVIASTMGSFLRVKVHYVELKDLLDKVDHVYLAAMDGASIHRMSSGTKGVLVMGQEGSGLSEELMHSDFQRISIPGKGKAESLNVAVAAGIILDRLV